MSGTERQSSDSMNRRIRELRKQTGLSQKNFGERFGRTDAYVCQMEKGRTVPTADVLKEMAEAFHVSREWLAEGKGEMTAEAWDARSLGQRLRDSRKKCRYTQEELAEAAGCSRNAIGLMERGSIRPSPERLQKIAKLLWVREDWLRTGRGEAERDSRMAEIFELLKRDASAREEIRRFIERMDSEQRAKQ